MSPFRVLIVLALMVLNANSAQAWGRRGHALICETAAALLQNDADFLKRHSYDLGYDCNVPDFVWRGPSTGAIEAPQHFMDMEIFERAFANTPSAQDPFALSRSEFESKYPSVPAQAGRAFWRIRELDDKLEATAALLRKKPKGDKPLQEQWLIEAGALGHYVGDLSMPLHLSEDYDGVRENQKGVHSFFEDVCVDELASDLSPNSASDLRWVVRQDALAQWPKYAKDKSTLDVIEALAKESRALKTELLNLDKKNGRSDIAKAAKAFEPLIRSRLVAGSLALAAIWRKRITGLKFDEDHFYQFTPSPAYITPGR